MENQDRNAANPMGPQGAPPQKKYEVSPDFWNPGSKKTRLGPIPVIGTLILAGFVLYTLLHDRAHAPRQQAGVPASACNPAALPPNGSIRVLDPSRVRRNEVARSGLVIENEHAFPVVVYLTNGHDDQAIISLSIAAKQAVRTLVPVDHYGIYFATGSVWCNDQVGFQNGYRIEKQDGVDTQANQVTVLRLVTVPPGEPDSFHVSVSTHPIPDEPPEAVAETTGPGYLALHQGPDGHYRSSGRINNTPFRFLVDTGASVTVIPPDVADQAGISGACVTRKFQTANGVVESCVANVEELAFGNFVVHNVEVAIAPNLAGDALLGMNILRLFQLNQQNGVMRVALP